MQKKSIRKISILGLVLMAASAITASMVPSKSYSKMDKFYAGSLTFFSMIPNAGSASSVTCAPDTLAGGIQLACNVTDDTESTEDWFSESTSLSSLPADGGAGGNNTSDAS